MPKTADFIEEIKAAQDSAENTQSNKKRSKRGNAARIAPWRWKPGQSGNPGGRPKNDVAAMICRAAFENNANAIYAGLSKQLIEGKPYALQVAGDRGYGKMKETHEHTGEIQLVVERLANGRKRLSNGKSGS
jgi:Family of unknown function (DUF5681)